jgi:hypothetical protein
MKSTVTLLGLSLLLSVSCQKKKEKTETVVEDTTIVEKTSTAPEKQCYLKVISKDSIIVEVERNGDSIHGIYHWKPFEKDKKISTYKGVLSGNTANVVAQSQQEGMNFKEEVIFTLTDNSLSIKSGEMIEGKDGIWKYKDKNAATEEVLNKVDCK